MTDQRIAKWTRWIEEPIRSDVMTMHLHRATWERLREITVGHGSLPDSYFWEYLRDTYAATQAVGVRRQADTHPDSASLGKLISEISASPELITREFWIGLWEKPADSLERANLQRTRIHYGQWGRTFGGDVGNHLDPAIPAADATRLAVAAAGIKRYVDENVAHSDKSPARVNVTFDDVHSAVDTLGELFTKYAGLLTAKGYVCVTPVLQHDWEAVFRQPWIRAEADRCGG